MKREFGQAAVLLGFLGAFWAGAAFAEDGLGDPTRPPASVASGESAPEGDGAAPVLQSILYRHGRKSVAVINGMTVMQGDKVGDATLVRVTQNRVVLRGPSGLQVLYLTPDVAKQTVKSPLIRQDGKKNRGGA